LLAACGSTDATSGNSGEAVEQKPVESAIKLKTTLDVEQLENKLQFTIALHNESLKDLTLPFGSGQQFEIVVKNEAGEEVYRYSEGKMFTLALQMIELKAGEKLEWQETWDLESNGQRIPAGTYTVIADVMVLVESAEEPLDIDPDQLHAEKEIEISGQAESGEKADTAVMYGNQAFRNVVVEGEKGHYMVTGEARLFEGQFMYAVSDGHNYLVEESAMIDGGNGAPDFSPFRIEISIPQSDWPENGTLTLEIYEISAKDGSRTNELIIPLEQF